MATAVQILIVEDDALTAADIRSQLVLLNYEVLGIAESGTKAVQLAKALCPDLILMDGSLKGSMDGFETARLVEQFLACPIIYITSNPRASAMRYSIRKPFTAASLASVVSTALSERHSSLP